MKIQIGKRLWTNINYGGLQKEDQINNVGPPQYV